MAARILMLLENEPYPDDTRVLREATTLVAAGYTVSIISVGEKGLPWRATIDGVHVYRYPSPGEGSGLVGYIWEYGVSLVASYFLSLYVFLIRGFDVIHAHNPPDLFVLIAIFYRVFGVRFVFDHHDLSPEMYVARFQGRGNRLVVRVLRMFEWLSCRVASHVIATNESYRALDIERNGVDQTNISVVRNGPDLKTFKLTEPDESLSKFSGTVIGYVGVMGFQDGLDYLLRALRHLRDDLGRNDFLCVLIGDGPAKEELERLTTEYDLDEHVRFTGCLWDEDLLRQLSGTDICVVPDPSNPYNDRSTMVKIMEYMALAKPIVAFDMPEHRASAGEAAIYAEPNQELDFASKLIELIDDSTRRTEMGQLGMRRVETELAWEFQAEHLLRVYRKLSGQTAEAPQKLQWQQNAN